MEIEILHENIQIEIDLKNIFKKNYFVENGIV